MEKERRFFNREERDNRSKVCEMGACGEPCKHKLEADHVVSWYKGGRTEEEPLSERQVIYDLLKEEPMFEDAIDI